MTEDSLTFESPDQILLLFGAQDRFLRQVRDVTGVGVTIRGDQIRLHGTEEQIRRGLAVFSELRSIIDRHGTLQDFEVRGVLGIDRPASKSESQSGVSNGTAKPTFANSVRNSQGVVRPNFSSASGRVVESPNNPQPGETIDLLEKARKVLPRSPGQAEYVRAIREHDLVFCEGPAGCGKTYLAVAMAVNALRQEQVRKIVLVRPAVEAGEKLGFLPGDMLAKINPFLRPLLDALSDMLDYEQVRRYIERDVVEIVPLAFMRGRTLNETFIILDEAQNTTVTQMKMFLTRLGDGSRIVVTGDATQTDLPSDVQSGLGDALRRLNGIPGIAQVKLTGKDIVRHPLVRKIVEAYDNGSDSGRRSS